MKKHVPFNLKMLDTCLPDYFQGFDGPVISFPVDARMEYSELIANLTDDDAWPATADIEDIRSAVVDLVGNVHSVESCPFHDIGPDAPPSTHFVSQHPTVHDMWMVIDKEDGEVMSSWPTEIEANIAAWGETGEERAADVYAYFGIELEVPEGYQVSFANEDAWSWNSCEGKEYENFFDTEMEAKVAAWQHKFANETPAEFIEGHVDKNECGVWTAGVHHTRSPGSQGNIWYNRIEVYGNTESDAREIRDRVLHSLNGATK